MLTPQNRLKIIFPIAACLALISMTFSAFALPQGNQPTRTLVHSAAPWTATAHYKSHHDTNDQLTIGLLLKSSHPDEQQSLLNALYNPHSPQYQKWIQSSDFNARFAPAASDVAAAKAFLSNAGLRLLTSDDDTLIEARGTTSQVEAAFHTQINSYSLQNGAVHYGNSTDVQVPSAISSTVQGVFGLSDINPFTSNAIPAKDAGPNYAYGGGPNGSGLTPSQIAGIYNATPVYDKLKDKGQGTTLAVYELSGYSSADIRTYEKQFHLPNVSIENKLVLGGPIAINGSKDYGASEVELDIELQIAAAPGIKKLLVYEAPNTELGALALYRQMATDNKADVISSSWGIPCEYVVNSQVTLAENQIFLQIAAQGQSLFVASGDAGAYGCSRIGVLPPPGQDLQIGDPNNQPYNTAVGGTSFRTQGGGPILFDPGKNAHPTYPGTQSETVWNRLCSPTDQIDCGNRGASGGGVSRIWAEPDYAFDYTGTGAPLPGVLELNYSQGGAYCGQQPGVLCRENPDVALAADPNTGYSVYCTDKGDSFCVTGDLGKPGWVLLGGTSCAAPVWSGFAALDDTHHKGRLGLFNYIVYPFDSAAGYASQLHDITIGDNGYYPAGPGYDMSTGVGTPNVFNLVNS